MPNWNEVFNEINILATQHQQQAAIHQQQAQGAVDQVRRRYLTKLHKHTDRNVIAYFSGWLTKPTAPGVEITEDDKNAFMMAVHQLDRKKGLDLILHTPGGDIAATQSIVFFLRQMFGRDIRAFVPQIAMSAGTMIACSCQEIWMGKHSCIGPIDPHIRTWPALGVKKEFERAYKEIKDDAAKRAVWEPILRQYPPAFLDQCDKAVRWASSFVEEQLADVMLFGKRNKVNRAKSIVKKLSDYDKNKTHNKHIHFDEAKSIGLNIKQLESDPNMQDLVLTVHHCFMHTLSNTNAFKIVENHNGVAKVRNVTKPTPAGQ